MNIKRILLILVAVILVSGTLSCSSQNRNDSRESLSIYIFDYDKGIKDLIDKFNTDNKKILIKETVFSSSQYKEFGEKLKSGLISGEGPDIVIAQPYILTNLSKFLDKGVFLNLDDMTKNDKSFKISEYFEKVMDYGIYKGKRYLLPLSFNIDTLFSTSEILDKSGVGTNIGNLKEFAGAGKKLTGSSNGNKKYLLSQLDFSLLMFNSRNPLIDVENKSSRFDEPEFLELLQTYKEIQPALYPVSGLKNMRTMEDTSGLLKNNEVVFLNNISNGPTSLWQPYSAFESEVDPRIFSIPSLDGKNRIVAKPDQFAAINSKCKNTKAAYEFIKLLLSKEYQSSDQMYSIPVRKDAYKQKRDDCIKGVNAKNAFQSGRGGGCKSNDTVKKLVTQFDEMVNAVDTVYNLDQDIVIILEDELQPFLEGKKTAEETASQLNIKMKHYFDTTLETPSVEKKKENSVSTQKNTLSIQYLDNQSSITNAIGMFNGQNKDVQIEGTTFPAESSQEFANKLATSIMAGEGSDIIVFRSEYFNSINKVALSGIFSDLNDFISKDSSFKLSDFNNKILETGVFSGKRYFVPLRYDFPLFTTSEGILKKNGISIDKSKWTWESLAEIAENYMKANKNKDKFFFGSGLYFSKILDSCGINFIDYENKKTKFNSKEFIDLLNIYKRIQPSVCTPEFEQKAGLPATLLKNGSIVMTTECEIGAPDQLWMRNSVIKATTGEDTLMIPMPLYSSGQSIPAQSIESAAVNAGCKNKEAAWNFIKLLISEDFQKANNSNGGTNVTTGVPVNMNAYKTDMAYYSNSKNSGQDMCYGNETTIETFKTVPIPASLAANMNNLVARTINSQIIDTAVYKIISEETRSFLEGKKSSKEAAKTIDEKVTLFLNE